MLKVDDKECPARSGQNLLSAAIESGVYIPNLCCHPAIFSCEEGEACSLCLVTIDNSSEPVKACQVGSDSVTNVSTDSDAVITARKKALARILATHPHACLICPEAEGCARTECSQNVPVEERCCSLFHNCEVRKVAAYIGISNETPRYRYQNLPIIKDQPFYDIDLNLCIACGRCVRVCRDVKKIGVFEISEKYGRPVAVMKGETLKESGCIFCGACVEVCPTGTLMDKPYQFESREESLVPCRATCPAEIDVPLYVRLVAEKRYGEAVAVIREKAPIPGILGRVCYNPCETGCRRRVWDEPVAIRSLKRFAADNDDGFWKSHLTEAPPTGKKVAIVGAGPSGLSAAYYLRLMGHEVDLYDAMPEPGGMLRYGIPAYRLDQKVLRAEIDDVLELGVVFHPSTRINSPSHFTNADAVFWATGAGLSAPMPRTVCPGDVVVDGLSFLRKVREGEKEKVGKRVAVIGGGNVATDVARTALRMGAHKVTLFYRRTRDEMPAYDSEIHELLAEGGEIRFLLSPVRIAQAGTSISAHFQKMRLGKADDSGRRRPEPIDGDMIEENFDTVFFAIGQQVEPLSEFEFTSRGAISVDRDSGATSIDGVFAGGDNVLGPSSVVEAVQAGRTAAENIDRYLGGEGMVPVYGVEVSPSAADSAAVHSGLEMPQCLKQEMRNGFDEIEQSYTEEVATAQANRCSRCDLRLSIPTATMPPDKYRPFLESEIGAIPSEPGVVTLLDKMGNILLIAGYENMRAELQARLSDGYDADRFSCEAHQMYTQRESEMLSQYLQQHGRLPDGNDLDDELF